MKTVFFRKKTLIHLVLLHDKANNSVVINNNKQQITACKYIRTLNTRYGRLSEYERAGKVGKYVDIYTTRFLIQAYIVIDTIVLHLKFISADLLRDLAAFITAQFGALLFIFTIPINLFPTFKRTLSYRCKYYPQIFNVVIVAV